MTTPNQQGPPPDLLARVAGDLRPVPAAAPLATRVLWWTPVGLVLFLGVPLYFGLRVDANVLGPWITWGASACQVALGIWMVWAGGRESAPGRRLPWRLSSAALILAASVIVFLTAVTFAVSPTVPPAALTYWRAGAFCFRGSLVVGAPLLFLAGWLLGRSLPGQPWVAGALFGGGAGLTADAGWRLVCPVSDPWHVLVGHGSAVVVLTIVGSVGAYWAARRRIGLGG